MKTTETENGAASPIRCPYCRRESKPEEIYCSACGGRLQKTAAPEKPARVRRRRPVFRIVLASAGFLVLLWVLVSDFRRNYLPARLGWHRSQYLVGAAYKRGRSVARDYVKASQWFKSAAEGGFAPAQFEYGVLRYYGLGTEENRGEAMGYLKKAADAGIPEAQFLIGSLLLDAPGAEEAERREAEQWLRLAAGKHDSSAEYRLANEYMAGSRLAKDYVAADILLKDLEDRGFPPAAKLREYLRASLMTLEERDRADKWETEHGR